MSGKIHSPGFDIAFQITDLERRLEDGHASIHEVDSIFNSIDVALAGNPHSHLLIEQKERAVSLAGRFDAQFVDHEVASLCKRASKVVSGSLGIEEGHAVIAEAEALSADHALSIQHKQSLAFAVSDLAKMGLGSDLNDPQPVDIPLTTSKENLEAGEELYAMSELLYSNHINAFFDRFNRLDPASRALVNAHIERRKGSLAALNSSVIGPSFEKNRTAVLQALLRASSHLAIGVDPQCYESSATIQEIFDEAEAF